MNAPMLHIRKNVLEINQDEMANIAGTSQGTVSKWENGSLEPDRSQLGMIRAEIERRGKDWDDRWFFETPATEPEKVVAS